MAVASGNRMGGLLQATGLFSEEQIQDLLVVQKETGSSITEAIVSRGLTDEPTFLKALAEAMKVPFVRVPDVAIPPEVLEKLPTKAVFQYNVIPIGIENGALRVATNDPVRPRPGGRPAPGLGHAGPLRAEPGRRHRQGGQDVLRRRRRHPRRR